MMAFISWVQNVFGKMALETFCSDQKAKIYLAHMKDIENVTLLRCS